VAFVVSGPRIGDARSSTADFTETAAGLFRGDRASRDGGPEHPDRLQPSTEEEGASPPPRTDAPDTRARDGARSVRLYPQDSIMFLKLGI